MSIEIEALIRTAVTLADVLAHAERLVARVPHTAFTVGSSLPPGDIVLGPFDVETRGPRRFKELFTIWDHRYLSISCGPFAEVSLALGYHAFPHEIDPEVWGPAEVEPGDDNDERGFQAQIAPSRTRPSFCLAVLLIGSIADRSGSRIVDEANLLKQGRIIDPAVVAAMFTRLGDAASFEELSDAFCDAIDFAPGWPTAKLERSSP